jgi:hypothetical protein
MPTAYPPTAANLAAILYLRPMAVLAELSGMSPPPTTAKYQDRFDGWLSTWWGERRVSELGKLQGLEVRRSVVDRQLSAARQCALAEVFFAQRFRFWSSGIWTARRDDNPTLFVATGYAVGGLRRGIRENPQAG